MIYFQIIGAISMLMAAAFLVARAIEKRESVRGSMAGEVRIFDRSGRNVFAWSFDDDREIELIDNEGGDNG